MILFSGNDLNQADGDVEAFALVMTEEERLRMIENLVSMEVGAPNQLRLYMVHPKEWSKQQVEKYISELKELL